jgi:ketosteroid isomerase-like protein
MPPNGGAIGRTGYMLTILRKDSEGRWRITRDADLLATEKSAN